MQRPAGRHVEREEPDRVHHRTEDPRDAAFSYD
jgi:hypothetical protein